MRKKVLFVIESLSGGGAEKVLTVLLKHIDKTRFDVTLCTVVEIGVYMDEVKKYVSCTSILGNPNRKTFLGKIWYRFKYKCVYNWLPLKWVYRLFIPQGNDVEVAFVEGFATKLMAASSNRQAKKLAWVHTDLINNHWIESIYQNITEERLSYQKYDQIIGVSKQVTNSVQKLYHLKNVITCYNPIESDVILKWAGENLSLPSKKESLRLVSVGRFVPQKAFDRLLRVVNRLYKEGFSLELWLLGDGEQRPLLEQYIRDKNLEAIVTLWGFQTNPYPYLQHSDLFVCSSVSEGYSTAVTEALIIGLPVVTTACSGMDELLDNGTYGTVTENDEGALYEGVKRCFTQSDLLNTYKEQAIHYKDRVTLKQQMSHIEELF